MAPLLRATFDIIGIMLRIIFFLKCDSQQRPCFNASIKLQFLDNCFEPWLVIIRGLILKGEPQSFESIQILSKQIVSGKNVLAERKFTQLANLDFLAF